MSLTLVLLTSCATLLFSEGAITLSDGRSMYQVASSIVEHGTLTVDSALGTPGRQGRYYSKYGLGLPIVAMIGYVAIRPFAQLAPMPDLVEQAGAASMMSLIYGLLVAAVYLLARRFGASPRSSVLASLGGVVGTYLLPYSKEFFSEPLTALCLTVSIERAIAGTPSSAAVAAGAAGLARPQALALVPILMWHVWKKTGWRGLGRTIFPLASTACILGAYNFIRFGSPFRFGYQGEDFTTPIFAGTVGLLSHPAKSLFLFAPIAVVLPFALATLLTRNRSAFWLIIWNLSVVFIMAATWHSWPGGWAWGPRLLITGIVPCLAAVALWCEKGKSRKLIALSLFGLGTLVSAPALVVSTRAQQLDEPPPPIGPGILRQYQLVAPIAVRTREHLFEYQKGTNREYLNLWQVGAARVLGKRGLILAAGLSTVLLVMATISGRRLCKILSATEGVGESQAAAGSPSGEDDGRR